LSTVEPEIRPEPRPEERRVILIALADEEPHRAHPPGYRSRWREAALEEGVSADAPAERGSAASD
jgi:hypothetical protein